MALRRGRKAEWGEKKKPLDNELEEESVIGDNCLMLVLQTSGGGLKLKDIKRETETRGRIFFTRSETLEKYI